jgi:hypothetical protein
MNQQHILAFLILLSICSCGRKQKNIFSFTDQDLPRANKLAFPAVKGIKVYKKHPGAIVTWFALDLPTTPSPTSPFFCQKNFVGYNVYRLVRINIIPKHPLNRHPLKTTEFFDKKLPRNNKPAYYLVRAVFIYNNAPIEGPSSLIVQLKG